MSSSSGEASRLLQAKPTCEPQHRASSDYSYASAVLLVLLVLLVPVLVSETVASRTTSTRTCTHCGPDIV
eukprot:scaffold31178_cov18-Prasinocladus_malaysianus.AAC.1